PVGGVAPVRDAAEGQGAGEAGARRPAEVEGRGQDLRRGGVEEGPGDRRAAVPREEDRPARRDVRDPAEGGRREGQGDERGGAHEVLQATGRRAGEGREGRWRLHPRLQEPLVPLRRSDGRRAPAEAPRRGPRGPPVELQGEEV